MNFSLQLLQASPLLLAFGSAILASFYEAKRWQNFILVLLGFLGAFFAVEFFLVDAQVPADPHSVIEFASDKLSVFIGAIFCLSLFMGLAPIRNENEVQPTFLYYVAGGLGLILSNNLFTFFIFWLFQRLIPAMKFVRDMRSDNSSAGGTFLIQHFLTFLALLALLLHAYLNGQAIMTFSYIPESFFTWPVLILAFVVIYESHGIFPFHSWVHDLIGSFSWHEISAIFLSRGGVILFSKFLLPTLDKDPDLFRDVILTFSIFSSVYWSFKGLFELTITRAATYFYVAQASLILSGLQATREASNGAYLHMLVISFCGTAIFSLVSYVQHYTSIKRLNQFYGLAQYYPKVATIFCLFGFCMIGIPLGASFVAEDLVLNGLLGLHPQLGLGHILAGCLNGILFFTFFCKLFLGQSAYRTNLKNLDMSLAQMSPYVIVICSLFTIGILPFLVMRFLHW
jgi:formate hydrogenlyase subunit 3/multisubunit Na+/H+ antiporter MnhD subunit